VPKKKVKPRKPTYIPGEYAYPEGTDVLLERAKTGESFVVADRLAILLNSVRGCPQQVRFDRIGHKLSKNSTALDRIRHCSQAFLSGALPDVETLEFIAVAFDRYVNSDGTLSLDEAFKLKAKPKAGNPVRQYLRNNKMNGFLLSMATYLVHHPQSTQEIAAAWAISNDESIPESTFDRKVSGLVREYRRRPHIARWVKTMSGK